MPGHGKKSRTILVSFSGIDGAGKSTQIDALCRRLREDGLCTLTVSFWDDVACLTRLRETSGHRIFKGDRGVGIPGAPIRRRDKNVRSWAMTWFRLFIYFLDAVSLRLTVGSALRSNADVIVFDRYVYDELANLPLDNPAIRGYVKMIMNIVPTPPLNYLLDADPEYARARKPEYPIEFLRSNRQSYLDLSELVGGMILIPAMRIEEVKREILRHALREIPSQPTSPLAT